MNRFSYASSRKLLFVPVLVSASHNDYGYGVTVFDISVPGDLSIAAPVTYGSQYQLTSCDWGSDADPA